MEDVLATVKIVQFPLSCIKLNNFELDMFISLNIYYIHLYVCEGGIVCHGTHVKVRGKLAKIGSLLPPCRSRGSKLRSSGL